MSRVAKKPISIPKGVDVAINGQLVTDGRRIFPPSELIADKKRFGGQEMAE